MSPHEDEVMSHRSTKIAKAALALGLLLAASPAREHSPAPLNGVRSALELISKGPDRAIRSGSLT